MPVPKPLGLSFNPSAALLALDLGTRCGWALWLPGGRITSGTQSFAPRRFDGGGMRFVRFNGWLNEVQAATQPRIGTVIFEEVRRHLSTDAAHAYGGFLAHLTAWCEQMRIPYAGVPVQHIKQFATGKGNAKKEAMIAAMEARGFKPSDDNEADALAMLTGTVEGAW